MFFSSWLVAAPAFATGSDSYTIEEGEQVYNMILDDHGASHMLLEGSISADYWQSNTTVWRKKNGKWRLVSEVELTTEGYSSIALPITGTANLDDGTHKLLLLDSDLNVVSISGTSDDLITLVVEKPFVNTAPTAGDFTETFDEVEVDEVKNISVSSNVTDPDSGQTVEVKTVTISDNDAGSVAPNGLGVDLTLKADFVGSFDITYVVNDGMDDSAAATIGVTVNENGEVNSLVDDPDTGYHTVTVGSFVIIDVLDNDSINNGAASLTFDSPLKGTATLHEGNKIKYTASEAGNDSFKYYVTDKEGAQTSANVNIEIQEQSVDNPVVADEDTFTISEDTVTTLDILENDEYLDGFGGLTIVTNGTSGLATVVGQSISFDPNHTEDDFTGTDTFTYMLTDSDGDTDTAVVTVIVVNDDDNIRYMNEDTANVNINESVRILVLNNDRFTADIDSVVISDAPNHGLAVPAENGEIVYTASDFAGDVVFWYKVTLKTGESQAAKVTVTVNAPNQGVTAMDDTFIISEDSKPLLDVKSNDDYPDGFGSLEITRDGQYGHAWVRMVKSSSIQITPMQTLQVLIHLNIRFMTRMETGMSQLLLLM